jgi:endonuclease G
MKRLLLLLSTAAVLFACTDGLEEGRTKASLEASQTLLDGGGGAIFIRVKAEGDWSLHLMEGSEWATLGSNAGRGSKNNILLSYSANEGEANRRLSMELVCGKESAFLAITQAAGTPETPDPPTPPTPAPPTYGSPTAAPHWLELPATSADDDLSFFSHDCTIGGKKLRNYAYYWNFDARVAHWVAYPLCSVYMGSSGRSEAWGFDPLMPASLQQDVSGGYQGSGRYDRGHQLPSADRTASYSLNATTFYGVNMTPQNNTLNTGVWSALESKVRDWAKRSDTLYVVTGCVVTGSTSYALDRSGHHVTVPVAYFKALLRYQKNSTIGYADYMAAGFWYDHYEYSQSGKSFGKGQSMSLDELEEKLGYKLFVNLPEQVGAETAAKIKSEKPANVSWWW